MIKSILFNIKQASIFLIVHTTAFNNKPNTLQIFLKQANIFLLRKHLKKREKNDPDRFYLHRCKRFFYLATIHTPPFLLRRALKLSFFFSYFNFNPPVIKIMFCHRIFFGVFIDSRNASIITFSRIF